jgi:membrane protein
MAITDRFDTQRLFGGAAILGALALAWVIEKSAKRSATAAAGAAHWAPAPQAYAEAETAQAPPSWQQSWAWWKRVAIETYKAIGEDRLLAVAAGVVFYALLAIFPTITAFVSFYGLFSNPATIERHLALLSDVLPAGGLSIVQEQIDRIAGRPRELSIGFIGGVAVALWSANAGVKAMIDALNVIEGREEQRGFFGLNLLSLSFTLGAILFLLTAVGAVVAFPLAMSTLGLDGTIDVSAGLIRWPLLFVVAAFAIAMLYRFGPSGKRKRERFFTPGVAVAALAWIVGSAALSFYMSNFADYNATYGSLGAGIGLMMWMWVSTIALLAGAEIDAVNWELKQSRDEPPGRGA